MYGAVPPSAGNGSHCSHTHSSLTRRRRRSRRRRCRPGRPTPSGGFLDDDEESRSSIDGGGGGGKKEKERKKDGERSKEPKQKGTKMVQTDPRQTDRPTDRPTYTYTHAYYKRATERGRCMDGWMEECQKGTQRKKERKERLHPLNRVCTRFLLLLYILNTDIAPHTHSIICSISEPPSFSLLYLPIMTLLTTKAEVDTFPLKRLLRT